MPEKKLNIGEVEWEYTTGGHGGAGALLMFHGAVGGAEGVGWLGDAFADECRTTIAPRTTCRSVTRPRPRNIFICSGVR